MKLILHVPPIAYILFIPFHRFTTYSNTHNEIICNSVFSWVAQNRTSTWCTCVHSNSQITTKPANHRHYHHQSPLSPKVTLSRGFLPCKSSNEHAKLSFSFRWSMNKSNASEWKKKTFSEWNDSSVRLSQPLFTGFCVVKAAFQKPRHTHTRPAHTACWLCCVSSILNKYSCICGTTYSDALIFQFGSKNFTLTMATSLTCNENERKREYLVKNWIFAYFSRF